MNRNAFKLAWRQLTFDRARLSMALSGVAFATILLFMQVGFKEALFDSATLLHRKINGDLFIMHKQSEAMWRMFSFSEQRLYQALSIPEVADVTPIYVGLSPSKNPETGINRTLFIIGMDTDLPIYSGIDGLDALRQDLRRNQTAAFDEYSRSEFGPIKDLTRDGSTQVEINGRVIDVVGTFRLGITFSANGNLIVNKNSFFYLFPGRIPEGVDIGVITLKENSPPPLKMKSKLASVLPEDVTVYTKDEYVAHEQKYWADVTPIGYVFNFGMIMGLMIGMVIVYQILFNDVVRHINEYATLKAMGYDDKYFIWVVFSAAGILAVLGFIPGYLISSLLYENVEKSIFISFDMTGMRVLLIFLAVLLVSCVSGFLTTRKLRAANPTEVFS